MSEDLINKITLDYLMNKELQSKNNYNPLLQVNNKKDVKFYKKRIYNLTRELILSKTTDPLISADITKSFDNYIRACIHYFKVLDCNDILQEDYKHIKTIDHEHDEYDDKNKEAADKLLMRKINIKSNNLDNFVTKTNIAKNNVILPRNKNIDLKDPKLKTKGITPQEKNKNIINIYEDKNNNKK